MESRGKKAAFLRSAARRMELRVEVVTARIDRQLPCELPPRIDFLTLRAVRLGEATWRRLVSRLSPRGCALLWVTAVPEGLQQWFEVEETLRSGERRQLFLLRRKDREGS